MTTPVLMSNLASEEFWGRHTFDDFNEAATALRGVGENVQLRTFLTRAAGAHASGKARGRPAIRRRVMTPVLSTTDPDRGTEVNLDETQQSPR